MNNRFDSLLTSTIFPLYDELSKIKYLKEIGSYNDIVEDFFEDGYKRSINNGIAIKIKGSKTSDLNYYLYEATNNKVLRKMPYIIIVDKIASFLSMYNVNYQDRSTFTSQMNNNDFRLYSLPLFMFLYDNINNYSFMPAELIINENILTLTFESKNTVINRIDSIEHSECYKLLIKELSLQDSHSINLFYNKVKSIETYNGVTRITVELYKIIEQDMGLSSRIIKYISKNEKVTNIQLASYYDVSKTTIRNSLNDLINDKRIKRVGKKNSPKTYYVLKSANKQS